MAVIALTISESEQQIVSGIPKSISVETNIPSTVFYTLDGTTPSILSAIYIQPISLPTNNSSVTLKLFASNGVDESVVFSETYSGDISEMRRPRAGVTGLSVEGPNGFDRFPYGGKAPPPHVNYTAGGGLTVDSPDVANIPNGFDGSGVPNKNTDKPVGDYDNIYSETDRIGQTGYGIGTLPGKVTIKSPPPAPVSTASYSYDKFFNPKAMIIYQDSSIPPYDPNISQLNREFFSLANPEKSREGAAFRNSSIDGNNVTGSFIRSQFNKSDNTMTYYYRDQESGRWIISKEKFQPTNPDIGALHKIVFSRNEGAGQVYKWLPFMSRHLR